MATYSSGYRTTGAGSATLPTASLYSSTTQGFVLREVGVFNTTVTPCLFGLRLLTTAGTSSAETGLTRMLALTQTGPGCTPRNVHSSTGPTITAGSYLVIPVGGAIGSGMIRPAGEHGIMVPEGVANGIGLVAIGGVTPQIVDVDWTWEEF